MMWLRGFSPDICQFSAWVQAAIVRWVLPQNICLIGQARIKHKAKKTTALAARYQRVKRARTIWLGGKVDPARENLSQSPFTWPSGIARCCATFKLFFHHAECYTRNFIHLNHDNREVVDNVVSERERRRGWFGRLKRRGSLARNSMGARDCAVGQGDMAEKGPRLIDGRGSR